MVLALLVEAGTEHETEEMGGAVAVLVQSPQSQAGSGGLGRSVAELVRRSGRISGLMDPKHTKNNELPPIPDVFPLTTSLTDCQGLGVGNLSEHESPRIHLTTGGVVGLLGLRLHVGRPFGGTKRFDGHFPL